MQLINHNSDVDPTLLFGLDKWGLLGMADMSLQEARTLETLYYKLMRAMKSEVVYSLSRDIISRRRDIISRRMIIN